MTSECPFRGSEPEGDISVLVSWKAVTYWMNRAREKHWKFILGLKHGKGFLQGPSSKRTGELLE
jgi:hypothetical protein